MAEQIAWMPLESNPEVMTKFLRGLGVPSSWQLVDVLGLDPELLQMVPHPVAAVLLLFPSSEEARGADQEIMKADNPPSDVYFMKQTIQNACGTIALIHAVANNLERIDLDPTKSLKKFLIATKSLNPDDRATQFEKDKAICQAHESHAQEGQTTAPNPSDPVNLHFVTFVNIGGKLYELDGRKPNPIVHGSTTNDTLLEDASKICKQFMERDPKQMQFSIVALAAAPGDH